MRYETLPAANAALAAVTKTGTVQVADVQRKEVSQEPPLLYDLTALQKEANGRCGFSADKTLSVAQSLYEKKVLSYPRTGSRYLSEDVFDEIPDRIALLERYPAFAAHAAVSARPPPVPPSSRPSLPVTTCAGRRRASCRPTRGLPCTR